METESKKALKPSAAGLECHASSEIGSISEPFDETSAVGDFAASAAITRSLTVNDELFEDLPLRISESFWRAIDRVAQNKSTE